MIGICFGFWILDFGFNKSQAQPLYTGIYWVLGTVNDPDGVGTEGRKVVLFKDQTANGFAYDLAGVGGLSGVAGQYRLNADEDERMNIAPGTYKIGIVKKDDYGMNPVDVTITGLGYDVFNVILKRGEGMEDPGVHTSNKAPRWESITFGNRKWQPAVYTGETKETQFIISSQPKITATVVSEYGIDKNNIKMLMNEGTANQTVYDIGIANIIKTEGVSDSPTKVTFTYDYVQAQAAAIPEGDQTFTFKASNAFGTTVEVVNATVGGGELIGTPIVYPSPVRLTIDKQVTFQYKLGKDMNVDLYMFDISSRVAKKMAFSKGQEGGSAGINKPTWNLITDQGQLVASGIYLFNLVDHDTGKLLGKGKLTAVPQ